MATRPIVQKLGKTEKVSKCGLFRMRTLKKGNLLFGHIWTPIAPPPPGERRKITYWAIRRSDQRFYKDNSWAIDKETITLIRPNGVTHVGIELADGTRYLTEMKTFGSWGHAHGVVDRDYSHHVGVAEGAKGQRGAHQWYVPMALWEKIEPPEEERHATIRKKMRIPASRRTASLGAGATLAA